MLYKKKILLKIKELVCYNEFAEHWKEWMCYILMINKTIKFIEITATIVQVINFAMLVYATIYEYVVYKLAFSVKILSGGYIRFLGEFSIAAIIYSLIRILINRANKDKNSYTTIGLMISAFFVFILFFACVMHLA